MPKGIIIGGLGAGIAALLGLDATLFRPSDYPLLHKLFDGDWLIARNVFLSVLTALAALLGYIALRVKNNGNTNGKPTPKIGDDKTDA